MKIGLESTYLVRKLSSGIPNYHYHLIKNIINISSMHKIVLFYQWFLESKNINLLKQFSFKNVELKGIYAPELIVKLGWRFLSFPPIDLMSNDLDVFHYSYYALVPIYNKNVKKIITIHDITPLLLPQAHTFIVIDFFNRLIKFARNEADLIIAVSLSTKNDLVNYCGIPDRKIRVIYEGVPDNLCNPEYNKKEDAIPLRNKYNINFPYILYVGSLEPRKNLIRAIKAFSMLIMHEEFKGYKFIFINGDGWKEKELFNYIKTLSFRDHLIFYGYIKNPAELALLYKNAELFIYPSLYEGFGLPPLEAMSLGVPVITSNVSSLPEVVGDAAIKINPYSVEEIYEAMKTVLSNNGLRTELSQKGVERAKMFSWEKAARETLAVYEEAMSL